MTTAKPAGRTIPAQYMVVSNILANKMNGSKVGRSKKGSIYGVFASSESAWNYLNENKMRLYAQVVECA